MDPKSKTKSNRAINQKNQILHDINQLNKQLSNITVQKPKNPKAHNATAKAPPRPKTPEIMTAVLQLMQNSTDLLALYHQKHDDYLRTLAAAQNEVKRHNSEVSNYIKYKSMDLARKIIPILDHFDRALNVKTTQPEVQSFLIGFKMIYQLLIKALEEEKIIAMHTKVGDKFDHHLHNAIAVETHADLPPNHIIKITSKGYKLADHVIRHAEVIVNKKKEQPKTQKSTKLN